jgi:hypothetical protein
VLSPDLRHWGQMTRIGALVGCTLIVLLVGTGCSQIRYERGQPLQKYAKTFEPDVTNYKEVMAVLGPPPRLSRTPAGFAYLYEHVQTLENQIGISAEKIMEIFGIHPGPPAHNVAHSVAKGTTSIGESIAGLIRILYAWEKGDMETLVFEFDDEGSLLTVAYLKEKLDLGSTIGVSLIVSASPKVGSIDYKISSQSLYWGLSLLEWTPRALNRPQSLSHGTSGVARSPAGFFVGQDLTVPRANADRREKRKANRR